MGQRNVFRRVGLGLDEGKLGRLNQMLRKMRGASIQRDTVEGIRLCIGWCFCCCIPGLHNGNIRWYSVEFGVSFPIYLDGWE